MAIEEEDASAWSQVQRTGLQRQELGLAREKFQRETCELFLRWRTDEESNRIAELAVPNEEKIALLRKHHFADVDALDKSGAVALPK